MNLPNATQPAVVVSKYYPSNVTGFNFWEFFFFGNNPTLTPSGKLDKTL